MKKITLEITEGQLIAATGGAALVVALAVCVGFYWGKQESYALFDEQLQQESLSDRIYTSLTAWYSSDSEEDLASEEAMATEPESEEESIEKVQVIAHPESLIVDAADAEANSSDGESIPAESAPTLYRAALAGFGSLHAAQRYAQKLASEGIEVEVLHRESRSARGKKVVWYQVVTIPQRKNVLDQLVARLQQRDKLAQVTYTEID